jgi:hypothetical protein
MEVGLFNLGSGLTLTATGHNKVITYAPVSLAVLKAFELDDGGLLPEE